MGPANGIIGGNDFGMDMPETQAPEDAMAEITKAAKFSKTAEFKELKAYLEARIQYFQANLPGGQPVSQVDPNVVGPMWVAADTVIREFQAVINVYESAAQQVKDESARRKGA